MMSVQQRNGYIPPPHVPMSPRAHTTMRVAGMAARSARHTREKLAQSRGAGAPGSRLSSAAIVRAPSPVNFVGVAGNKQFHVKKNLQLQLNMDAVKKPELPLMVTIQTTTEVFPAPAPFRQRVQFADTTAEQVVSPVMVAGNDTRRRRASSVTLSMSSLEGAEFQEVAHDGPAELGKRTKRVKKLGKGAGGTVYMSIYLPELKLVAVKEVVVYKEEERHMVKHELHALHENLAPIDSMTQVVASPSPTRRTGGFFSSSSSSSGASSSNLCPYQVSFYGAYLTPAKCAVSIVMEFMDMGSLQDLIDAKVSIPEPVVRHGAFCCLTALEHMHGQRMIHRDIKPANILLNRKGDFKVADFGLAGTLSKSASYFSEFEGTMMYMAPERISGKNYTYVSDIWSLGVVLFSLATGAYPFAVDDGFFGLEEAICTDPLPPMPNKFSPECRDFLKGLIRRDPDSRLTSTQALAHPFLRGYKDSAAHRDFENLWLKMPLRSAIKPEDAAKIAQVVVGHSYRHPNDQFLPESVTHALCSSSPPRKEVGIFSKVSDFFGGGARKHVSHLGQLADECGVTVDYLERLLEQELAK